MFPLPPERCVPSGWSPHSPGRAAAAELFPGQGVRSALKYQVKAADGSRLARNSAQTKQQEQQVCQPVAAVGSFWGSLAVTELCVPACPRGAGGKVQCPGLTQGEKILQPQGEKHEEKQTRAFTMGWHPHSCGAARLGALSDPFPTRTTQNTPHEWPKWVFDRYLSHCPWGFQTFPPCYAIAGFPRSSACSGCTDISSSPLHRLYQRGLKILWYPQG